MMKMKAVIEPEINKKVKELLPWASSDYLERAMREKRRELSEVLELVDALSLSEIPEEIRGIVKRPCWETFLADWLNKGSL